MGDQAIIDKSVALVEQRKNAELAIAQGRSLGNLLFTGEMQLAPVEVQSIVLAEYDARRMHFLQWLLSHMKEGVHYGVPPGCEPRKGTDPKQWTAKPSLYKAGGHLVIDLLQLQDTYTPDRDMWEMMGSPVGTVCIHCDLSRRSSGEVLSRGHGTMEAKEKSMGINSRVKIAKKRAMIDAVLLAVPGLTDLFTQDMEEDTNGTRKADAPPDDDEVTEPQLARLASLVADPRLNKPARAAIRGKMKTGKINRKLATSIIFKAKESVARFTGEPYVPFEDTGAADREPEDDEALPAESPADADPVPEFPNAVPPAQERAEKAAGGDAFDEALKRGEARGKREPEQPQGQQALPGAKGKGYDHDAF